MGIMYEPNRTVIRCGGDIGCDVFEPQEGGPTWVRLWHGPEGEIGRTTPQGEVSLATCDGVLVAAMDARSLDVISDAFARAAESLR
jgi:hypothetical protein